MTYHAVNAHNVMCPHSHHHISDAIDCIKGFEVPCGRVIDSRDKTVATVTDRETWVGEVALVTINELIARCEGAQSRGGVTDDFVIRHYPEVAPPWLVGCYTPDDGKCTASGETLDGALTAWLADYEHWWTR